MSVHYLVVKGPFGDMKVNPKIFKFEFNENDTETQFVTLPLPDSAECNRLLAAKTINLRCVQTIFIFYNNKEKFIIFKQLCNHDILFKEEEN